MRAVIYARVSTEEQKKGWSLKAPIDACRKYCEMKGWEVAEICTDIKSAKEIKGRSEFQRAVRLVKEGAADVLIAWRLDRITRNTKDFLFLCEELTKKKDGNEYVGITTVVENIDLTTAIGRAFATIVAAMAQLEREQISERTRLGLQKAREAGKKPGWQKGKSRIPEWKKKKIIELYQDGATYEEIREEVKVGSGTITRTLRQTGLIG